MSTTREELITVNHALLKRIDKLERENKKAMETIGRMTIRISELENPFSWKPLFEKEKRMTIDELSTSHIKNVSVLLDEKDELIKDLDKHLDTIERERSSSQGDTDLLARKRMPR
jgi:hypothetical protein